MRVDRTITTVALARSTAIRFRRISRHRVAIHSPGYRRDLVWRSCGGRWRHLSLFLATFAAATVFRKKREKHATWTPPSTDSFRVSGSRFSTAQGRVVETRIGDRDRDRDRDRAHAVDQPRILASLYPRYRGISTLGGCAVARATESQGGEGVCSTHATGWVLDARRGGGNTRRERRQRGQRIAVSSTAVGRRSRTARTRVGG